MKQTKKTLMTKGTARTNKLGRGAISNNIAGDVWQWKQWCSSGDADG
jgi:hypothetical protein